MQKDKGISMISLVVTIIVTILLAGFSIVIGSRYLSESRKKNTEVFVSVLSNAVSKRHEDTNLDSDKYQYLGYYVNDSTVFSDLFASKIPSTISFDDGIWYVVDTKSAAGLGVSESQEYIGTVDASGNADGKVALVNYADGSVYIIDIGTSDISGLSLFEGESSTIHVHRYISGYPTCTLPKKCVDCGFIKEEALGHDYEDITPTPTVGDEENSHYTKRCTRCGMPGGYEAHTAVYTYLGSWSHKTKCTVCGYESPSAVACTIIYSKPDDYTRRPDYHVKSCSVCGHSEEEEHTFAYRRISYAEHEKYCSVCDYVVLSEHHVDIDPVDDVCDKCESELVAYPLFRIVTMVNSSATDESGRHVAKYGDTIELTLSTDKEIKNLVVYIAGQRVPNGNMTTSDNRNWKLTLTLTSSMNIPDGDLSLKINCESMSGVAIPVPITTVTDGRFVSFDGTPPILQYIKKIIRAKE